MNKLIVLLALAITCMGVSAKKPKKPLKPSPFVQMKDGHFLRNGKPYYYVGTNFWYGAILGSEGQGGDRQRLVRELDNLKSMGIDNLRILEGFDGEQGVTTKGETTLQKAPGG